MFEKEAEEYVIKKHHIDKTKLPIDFSLRCEFSDDFTDFQKGAEFGFNKANEWHDLRKDPNALPNNYRYVWTNVGAGYYDDDGWRDEFGRLLDVIAWCEPKFEE